MNKYTITCPAGFEHTYHCQHVRHGEEVTRKEVKYKFNNTGNNWLFFENNLDKPQTQEQIMSYFKPVECLSEEKPSTGCTRCGDKGCCSECVNQHVKNERMNTLNTKLNEQIDERLPKKIEMPTMVADPQFYNWMKKVTDHINKGEK